MDVEWPLLDDVPEISTPVERSSSDLPTAPSLLSSSHVKYRSPCPPRALHMYYSNLLCTEGFLRVQLTRASSGCVVLEAAKRW